MSTITSVKLWHDTGYTEGSSEIPPVGHTLGTPDLVLTGPFTPAKGRLFSELQVKESFTDLMNCSYLEVEFDFNNGLTSKTFFGWIDDISISSDNANYPMTVIKWHVDLWRTFNQHAEYGSGLVVRKPPTSTDLFQNYPHRFKVLDSTYNNSILDKQSSTSSGTSWKWWWIIAAQTKNTSGDITSVVYYTGPLARTDTLFSSTPFIRDTDGIVNHTADIDAIINAKIDEMLGINPDSITGAWLCPVCPMGPRYLHGSGSPLDPLYANSLVWFAVTHHSTAFGNITVFRTSSDFNSYPPYTYHATKTLTAVTSEEGSELIVTGPLGEIIGTIPFGKSIGNVEVDVILSSVNSCMRLGFGPASEGMVFEYPLPTFDINTNSWSSYVYSGQRDYDIRLRRENSIKGAIENGLSGAGSGAITGALIGGPVGAGIGAVAGLGASVLNSSLDLTVFNDKFQSIEDRYHASQADTALLAGNYAYYLYAHTDGEILVRKMLLDSEAQSIISNIKTVQGVRYGAPVADCTSLIATGGPLQISNLIVKGDIPVAAKKWIKQKFADGVRIVSR